MLAALGAADAGAAQESRAGSPLRVPSRVPVPASVPAAAGGASTAAQVLASALLPGSGQVLAGRPWVGALFAVAEGAAWWVHLDARSDRDDFRNGYRNLAWEVARDRPAPRIDPAFEYYERLIYWTRSGAYDADSGAPGVQPERAPDSWNGRQWRLAADIFLEGDVDADPGDPGYASALAYYVERAYETALEWDWTGHDGDRDRYAGLIEEADGASRRASIALGAVVANHVLSAVESYVAARLGARRLELDVTPGPGGGAGPRSLATFRVRFLHPR